MKKSIFAVMAFVLVALLAGCTKESKSEINLVVSDVTDSTAVLKCEFAPQKSVRYTVTFAGQTLIFNESMTLNLTKLAAGNKYNVVAIAQDADKKEVDQKVVDFMTTGVPDNMKNIQYGSLDGDAGINNEITPEASLVTSFVDTLPTEVSITTADNTNIQYEVVVEGPNYSKAVEVTAPRVGARVTTIFTGLESGKEYYVYSRIVGAILLMGFVKK